MKVPHIESNLDSNLDKEIRSKCHRYQARMKEYHDSKHHAAQLKFSIVDVVFCGKANKLDSQFHPAKHVIIKTQGRDTFTLVDVTTGNTLIRTAKYLKHVPIPEEVIDSNASESKDSKDDSIDSSDPTHNDSSEVSQNDSDACTKSEPTSPGVTQATQNESSVTTRSGCVVKSTQDHNNFVYY